MEDLHKLNGRINEKAGRKLLPSIVVSVSLLLIIWFALAFHRELFAVVIGIAVILGIREIVRAFDLTETKISFPALAVATVVLTYATWKGSLAGLAIATAFCLPNLLILLLRKGPVGFVKNATATTLVLIYLPFLAGFLILLARPYDGLHRVMTFVVLISCNDTFGYLVGVLFGKHALVPTISPKKTWEGLAGSIVFTVIGGSLSFHYLMHEHWWIGALVGFMVVFTATSGDLIESALKRDLAIKDMGSILPGHGGILDRLDSALLSAPAVWLAFEVVKRYL
ncbi:MAG: phosphatidate cytidylyltransferase [Actinobacteria bacterium]|nr:phosphatidate cytidylyltransferase [Actinomycetota bacterium]